MCPAAAEALGTAGARGGASGSGRTRCCAFVCGIGLIRGTEAVGRVGGRHSSKSWTANVGTVGAVLVNAIVSDDGESTSVGELLRIEAGRGTSFPLRAQVLPGFGAPQSSPHLYFEQSADDGATWTEWSGVGEVRSGYVVSGEAPYDSAAGLDYRFRWTLAESDRLAPQRLYVWLGLPPAAFR